MIFNNFSKTPLKTVKANNGDIYIFDTTGKNIDSDVVNSFGEEWSKFNQFSEAEINKIGEEYFDIIDDNIINKNTTVLDVGCGTGRWSKYLVNKVKSIDAIDPSNAIFAADQLIGNSENVRLSMASVENIPFEDNTFDFVMSIGVLHHIPNTLNGVKDCVKKVKKGGYFYVYLYYNLEGTGFLYQLLFSASNIVRLIICNMPSVLKKFVCDIIAICVYMPFVIVGKILNAIGLNKLSQKMPLSTYQTKSFYVVRNDALDRFGTKIEQRFSKQQITDIMLEAGLVDIVFSKNIPLYHAIGRKA